ncbi:MAG: LamG-like jellyroll fold domain-containing protein [Candidatus Altimarinota bacterium]
MNIISSKFFLLFSVLFGVSFLGFLWFSGSLFSEAQQTPLSVNYNHQGQPMTLTRILAADRTADTGTKACAKLTGSNGQPMVCRNNVESFPYLGDKGCKQFYPGFAEFTSTYPGHGAHGGNYDIICLANSPVGDGGTCSGMGVNTCTTCPQCAKNLDCDESLAAPSNFADGAIVRCFDAPDAAPVATVGGGSLSDSMVLKMTFDAGDAGDSSGQANHGTVQGGVNFTNSGCRQGACAQFDGVNDVIFANATLSLPGDMTMMTWVKGDASQLIGARVLETQSANGVGASVYFDAGRLVLDNEGGLNAVLSSGSGFENQWHHVAVVRSGTTYALYVDGTWIGNQTGTVPTYNGYHLARWSRGGSFMKGMLDEVYLFNRALSPSEVVQVKDTGVSASSASSGSTIQSLPPAVDSTVEDGVFLTEVKGAENGNVACANFNKVCVGPSTFNRAACLDFYPHAASKNAAVGPQSEHFCKAGSTTGVCTGTGVDTCVMAVSSSQQVTCESVATNVDSFFVECEDPYSPIILEQTGGTLPPLSTPEPRNDGSGYVDYTATIHHPQQLQTQIRVEYSDDGGQTYQQATIVSAVASEGTVDVGSGTYQIGSVDAVDTDVYESVVVDFVWDTVADGVTDGDYELRITVQDSGLSTTTDVTEPFEIDEGTATHGSADGSSSAVSSDDDNGGAVDPGEEAMIPGGSDRQSGRSGVDGDAQNCFETGENGETPCATNEEILEFLDEVISTSIEDADWSEKEQAKAEFIQRYLSLHLQKGQSMEQMLQLFDHGMTRGEAVEILVFLLSSHGVIFENGGLPLEYSDISREHPYSQSIAYGTAYGIVEGYPDGSFRPDQAPNVAEMARMVVRTGALIRNHIQDVYAEEVLNDAKADWFMPYLKTLQSFGLSVPMDYESLGMTVSGLRFLDVLYDLLSLAGVQDPFQG